MPPVLGCTMPAVPPMPSTRWGMRGSTPPMGMRQYSSSSMAAARTGNRFSGTAIYSPNPRLEVALARMPGQASPSNQLKGSRGSGPHSTSTAAASA
jgi:hypothetical protein